MNSTVAGWDDHEVFTQRIRNYTAKPIDVEIRRSFDGHVVVPQPAGADAARLSDGRSSPRRVQAGREAGPAVRDRPQQGRNAKQNNVTLEAAEVKP